MALQESEEKTKEVEVAQRGDTRVVREKTSTASSEENRLTVVNGIWLVFGIVEVLLTFRFFLKLFGANPNSGFTQLVYSVSGVLTAPFRGIFSTPTAQGDITKAVFETSTIVAMVVYLVITLGIVKLATLNKEQ